LEHSEIEPGVVDVVDLTEIAPVYEVAQEDDGRVVLVGLADHEYPIVALRKRESPTVHPYEGLIPPKVSRETSRRCISHLGEFHTMAAGRAAIPNNFGA
jgi:hypothetical protein